MNRERLQEHEARVLAQMIWALTYPGPHIPDEISTPELVRYSDRPGANNRLYGMTEGEIRNAVRRLKRKGLIKRAWQKENPDQPSGEYGEVWSDDPFIPHHGYTPSESGMQTDTAKEAKAWVDREWEKEVQLLTQPEPESSREVEGT